MKQRDWVYFTQYLFPDATMQVTVVRNVFKRIDQFMKKNVTTFQEDVQADLEVIHAV